MQSKHNSDFDLIPKALGARQADGANIYLAATKVWLDGPFGRSWLADFTLRESNANQMGCWVLAVPVETIICWLKAASGYS